MEHSNRYFLEMSYDGTAYHGWQVQPNAVTVQETLHVALRTVLREEVETVGAGRTDTGVHAKQMYVHFDSTNKQLKDAPDKSLHALNALLPADIAARRLIAVHADAHARFDATERSYEYHIHFHKDPFRVHRSWQMRSQPDREKMNQAAAHLLGTQDFACFSKSNTQVHTHICTIKHAHWEATDEGMVFRITANRFLRNMVRAIVGTLIAIGTKDHPASYMKEVIASGDRAQAGASVPAHGLYLTRIIYPYIS